MQTNQAEGTKGTTFQDIVTGFKPQFGNANHIAAVSLIDKAAKLQKRLDGYNERAKTQKTQPKPPKALINELNQVENRVIGLFAAGRSDVDIST
jgi:hypothetical protein